MEKVTRCFMSVLLLSAVLSSGLAEDKFFAEGGTLELGPNFSGNIETVTWKLNNDMVAEWLKKFGDLTYYDTFKGRTNLNKVTGTLNITKLTPADSGVYSVEINNMVRPEKYNVKVIKEVPQPAVLLQPLTCSRTSENCSLLCERKSGEALALAEAELVTYSWKMGDKEWVDGKQSRDITDKETQRDKTFSCRMKNPISEKHSDTIENIFYNPNPADDSVGESSAGAAIGGVFGVILALVAGGVVGYVKREDIKKLFTKSAGNNKTDDVEQAILQNRDDGNIDPPPPSKEVVNGDAPKGDNDGAAPKGDDDGAAPKGDDDEAAPKGDHDEAASKGDDDEAASKGDDDEAAPKGDHDEAAPKGDHDEAAPKGDHDEAASKGKDVEAPDAASKTGTGEESDTTPL